MKSKTFIILGIILIFIGISLYLYYDFNIRPNNEAKELIVEAKMIAERGDKESINRSINILTKIIAKYPETDVISNAYYYIGQCYEKLGLHRLAYLKYIYIIKNNGNDISDEFKKKIIIRLSHIKVLMQYSEEAINQLYSLLNSNFNKEFRSRIYTELGHTYLKRGEYTRAKRMFDISITEYGRNDDAILGKARACKRMGHDDEAYNLYDHFLKYYGAVSQYTNDVKRSYKEQAYNSGLKYYRNGSYNRAITFFNRILRHFSYDKRSENALYWIGECYYAMRNYDKAINYFNRTLSNSFYHKDEDARIKKGYSYFNSKKFELAAREFQIYLHHYSNGKYTEIARNWQEMSKKEILLRINKKRMTETEEGLEENDDQVEEKADEEKDEEVLGYYKDPENGQKVKLENVAEL